MALGFKGYIADALYLEESQKEKLNVASVVDTVDGFFQCPLQLSPSISFYTVVVAKLKSVFLRLLCI